MIAEGNNEMFQSVVWILLWKQMISIHRIQFQILLQLTWRCSLKSIIPNVRILRGEICGFWPLLLNTNRQPFNLLNYHWTKDWKVLLILSNLKFWIRMKNEYPNLHEIAMRFLRFSNTSLLSCIFFHDCP
jgi:hypothetical protein